MTPVDILREAYNSDTEMLKRALDSDQELIEMVSKWFVSLNLKFGRLLEVLLKNGLIKTEDVGHIFSDTDNDERPKHELSNEAKKLIEEMFEAIKPTKDELVQECEELSKQVKEIMEEDNE